MDALPLVLSSGWAAGVNAYATVLLLGIFGRLGLGDVPDGLEDWWVIGAAAALYSVEFVTDKIPYVDHVWDAIHTAIRPTIAAVIGLLMNEQAGGLHDALAAVGAGGTALASHAVKAGLRAAVNLSPDPVTTATASVTEDFLVAVVTGSGERLTAARRPAFTPWLASAVPLAPTAARASWSPSAWSFMSTPITAAIAGRIAVWIASQTWST